MWNLIIRTSLQGVLLSSPSNLEEWRLKEKSEIGVGLTNITRLVQHRDESCIHEEFFPKYRADYKCQFN